MAVSIERKANLESIVTTSKSDNCLVTSTASLADIAGRTLRVTTEETSNRTCVLSHNPTHRSRKHLVGLCSFDFVPGIELVDEDVGVDEDTHLFNRSS